MGTDGKSAVRIFWLARYGGSPVQKSSVSSGKSSSDTW